MPDGLYEQDALAWSERQAALLRRLAAGERVNEAVDWANVIEEVQDVGLSELHGCESLLEQALRHLLKLHVWPDSPSAAHWRGEIVVFLGSARRRFSPSMRQRIYADALRAVETERGQTPLADIVAGVCPFTLDDLLSSPPDVAELMSRLGHIEVL